MEDSKKIKPYILHLNKQIKQLTGEIDKLTSKSLDEQLLLLQDEKQKLDLSNKYAYILSSLCFAYMKVLNVKDFSSIMAELGRCKSYMDKSKQLETKQQSQEQETLEQEKQAKKVLQSALSGKSTEPAISSVHFQGKHTKFADESATSTKKDKDTSLVDQVMDRMKKQKQTQKQSKTKASGRVSKK
ncbi:exosome complex protein LRP1 [Kluyveromyces marxianus DMKU3-1042]|uniref:Exosome complex protein n=2 Tax=Kluyveromyces marxianus TaxID=4911 RepID=W0TCP5_KLUMD|nr:exosome complex protein LRP1 [Kluyveromyces marxianus DMKU3-1042]BAO41397.1 exosome complex protein LRP1 [Kluyveromyces marxianus DMKU3-1042]